METLRIAISQFKRDEAYVRVNKCEQVLILVRIPSGGE